MTKTIDILNQLIEVCQDGSSGYRTASMDITNSELKTLFNQYSQQRHIFITELQDQVKFLGDEPQETGSIKSTLHRAWIDIKSAFTNGGEKAIINECINGDKIAIATYEKNLKEELPANIRSLLQTQLDKIRLIYEKLNQL